MACTGHAGLYSWLRSLRHDVDDHGRRSPSFRLTALSPHTYLADILVIMADPAAISTNALSTASGDTNGVFPGSDAAGQTVAAIAQAETISAGECPLAMQCMLRLTPFSDEIALYDRQIRLWGVQAQEKIRTANVLLICVKALANEIAKNLVLAGIGSLTLADHEVVTGQDLGAQFFVSEEDIGKNVRMAFRFN